MTDVNSIKEFTEIGKLGGDMTPLYLYRLKLLAKVIKSGDKVLDLGCGSGELLLLIAQCFPDAQFVGVDLSENMLIQARKTQTEKNTANVKFLKQDIKKLSEAFANGSFDVVISTNALHHLPNRKSLEQVMIESKKVLKSNGRFSYFDLQRMKNYRSMYYFVQATSTKSGPVAKEDFLQSLKASFSKAEFQQALKAGGFDQYQLLSTHLTFISCYFKNLSVQEIDPQLPYRIEQIFKKHLRIDQKISYYFFKLLTKIESIQNFV